jgi:hypothetical protein
LIHIPPEQPGAKPTDTVVESNPDRTSAATPATSLPLGGFILSSSG